MSRKLRFPLLLLQPDAFDDSPTAGYSIHFVTPGTYTVWSWAYAGNADVDAVNVGLKHYPPEWVHFSLGATCHCEPLGEAVSAIEVGDSSLCSE